MKTVKIQGSVTFNEGCDLYLDRNSKKKFCYHYDDVKSLHIYEETLITDPKFVLLRELETSDATFFGACGVSKRVNQFSLDNNYLYMLKQDEIYVLDLKKTTNISY